ncbi:alpha/beta hydrolase [Ornithinimicrobium sp. Arc0846-15]|nr:alpha/beta hydrolase [Ornithinimicrobium laminariae]
MTTFVLLPGGGGQSNTWQFVVDRVRGAGHEALAIEIQQDDPKLGLPEYAQITAAAIARREQEGPIVVAALSLGGFTAPDVALASAEVSHIVLVNAMIPLPGETASAWWEASGSIAARDANDAAQGRSSDEFDPDEYFYNGLSDEARAVLASEPDRYPAGTPFAQTCAMQAWPNVPTTVLVGADDRFFPAAFQKQVAKDRLGLEAQVIPGGHMLPLANPEAVTAALLAVS